MRNEKQRETDVENFKANSFRMERQTVDRNRETHDQEHYKNSCSILVSSCDKNEELWGPFFKILKIQWPDLYFPIILNTETKKFHCKEFDVETFSLYNRGEKPMWGQRLKETLQRIKTKYVLFILDDYFPVEPVDQKRIEKCIDWMDENKEVAVFDFYRVKGSIDDNRFDSFEIVPKGLPYRLNCSVALWRKESLFQFTRKHESPWQFEIYGSRRSDRYKELIYSATEGKPYIYKFEMMRYGIIRSKWFPETVDLFERFDIDVDFSRRGFMNPDDPYGQKDFYSIREHFPNGVLTVKFYKELKTKLIEKWAKFKSLI